MKYRVGQVLYVVLKRETRIYPMQIIEEITKKTLEGEVTSYMVRGGTDPKAQMLISEVDGEIFDSADKARTDLINRATLSIQKLVSIAVQKASEWYPNSFEAPSDDPLVLLKKTPRAHPTPPIVSGASRHDVVSELKAELEREAFEAEEADVQTITLPDGSKAKVRSVKLPESMS